MCYCYKTTNIYYPNNSKLNESLFTEARIASATARAVTNSEGPTVARPWSAAAPTPAHRWQPGRHVDPRLGHSGRRSREGLLHSAQIKTSKIFLFMIVLHTRFTHRCPCVCEDGLPNQHNISPLVYLRDLLCRSFYSTFTHSESSPAACRDGGNSMGVYTPMCNEMADFLAGQAPIIAGLTLGPGKYQKCSPNRWKWTPTL